MEDIKDQIIAKYEQKLTAKELECEALRKELDLADMKIDSLRQERERK